jgi:hypothetical protein
MTKNGSSSQSAELRPTAPPTTAELRALDDAPTPVSGTPIARIRRLSRRFSRKVSPAFRNRRSGWIVLAFCVLLALALALYVLLADEPEAPPASTGSGEAAQ